MTIPLVAGDTRPAFAVVPDHIPDDALDLDQLGSRIIGLAGRLASAMCRWLLLVAAFDAQDGARRFCLPSTARWLGHYCGLSRRTAIEHVRVARALAAHPALAESMAAGRVSFSHARAIARIADFGDAGLVTDLVMSAEHGTVAQLEDLVRGLRTVEHSNTGGVPAAEAVSHRWRVDSYLGVSAKLDPEHGALFVAAIEMLARAEDITHAQALTRMAEIAAATLNAHDGPAPTLRGHEYAAIVVHFDASRVPPEGATESFASAGAQPEKPQGEGEGCSAERGSSDTPASLPGEPYARIARGPGLPDATVKRLLCSGRVRVIVADGDGGGGGDGEDAVDGADRGNRAAGRGARYRWRSGVLDVGANRRLVSDKQFRALLEREGGCCSVPGCGSSVHLEAHHVRPWLYGGKTVMANLVLLCRAHHHAIHEAGEFSIVADGRQRFRFYASDGRELPRHSDPGDLGAGGAVEEEHRQLDPWAATTRWDGKRLDHGWAVAVLAAGLDSSAPRVA